MSKRENGDERAEKECLGLKEILACFEELLDVQVKPEERYEHAWTREELEKVDEYIEYIKLSLELSATKEQIRALIEVIAIDRYIRQKSYSRIA